MVQEYKFAASRQLSQLLRRMTEVLPVAFFGKFNFFCDFAESEGEEIFSKHVHFIL